MSARTVGVHRPGQPRGLPPEGGPYRLKPLTFDEAERWDELISPYESHQLFHRRLWLDYLSESQGLQVRFWKLERSDDHVVGYFCAGLLRKGPFRILGSPLRGWGTNFLGPVVQPDVDQRGLLLAIDAMAAEERVSLIQIEHPLLEGALLRDAGYEPRQTATFVVTLRPGAIGQMWRTLSATCRNRIRKAERTGLTVEDTEDPHIANEFYDQYVDVLRRQRLAPSYPRTTAQLLVRHLKAADKLLALRVRDADRRVLATGLFPHDDRTIYFWGGASRSDSRSSCPNELLHWRAMCLAAERGLRSYNMSGDGQFKRKFGGELVPLKRWSKFFRPSARPALHLYAAWSHAKTTLPSHLLTLLMHLRHRSP